MCAAQMLAQKEARALRCEALILQARELMRATQMTRGPLHQQTARIPAVTNQALAGRGGQGQRGRGGGQGQRGRGAAALKPRTSFEDDSDEEAYTTTASVQSNAHSPYAAGVCKSISFENNRMKIVNDIHEQILQTDLQQRFEEGREDALHEQAYKCGRAFGTAATSNFWQDAEGFSDGFSDGLSEAGEERDADRDNDEEREACEERDAGRASVVSCNRITAI